MDFIANFKQKLSVITPKNFEEAALQLFRFQAKNNAIYALYLHYLGVKPNSITRIVQIPFMPIEFFKNHQILTFEATQPTWEATFESSGTTGKDTSKHYVIDLAFYLQTAQRLFEQVYGSLTNYHLLALLPSYLERQNSSLVCMVEHFTKQAGKESGFFLYDQQVLADKLLFLQKNKQKVLLIGVTFALLDFAENYQFPLTNTLIMETGGMKGRRKELLRQEVHKILCEAFHLQAIHAEYGMTELLSQAYSQGGGVFHFAPTMQVILRNLHDPFDVGYHLKDGGLNIIDLANIESCAFIETKDLGRVNLQNHTFEVMGRYDHADLRGCNLLVANV
jgi:hypothetical protein